MTPRADPRADKTSAEAPRAFATILVGDDGRAGGRDALALALRLADHQTEVVPVRVSPSANDIAVALHARAKELAAELIVVGANRRTGLWRVLLGDDARLALLEAPCAVAVAPAGYADAAGPIRSVGVGLGGSGTSRRALALAQRITTGNAAELHALEVTPLAVLPITLQGIPELFDVPLDEARMRMAELHAGAHVIGHVRSGEPEAELRRFAAELDVLVLGARHRPVLERLLAPGPAKRLVRRLPCALVVTGVPVAAAGRTAGRPQSQGHLTAERRGVVPEGAPRPRG